MANNTNAVAIAFSNQQARPAADALITAYLTAKTFLLKWAGEQISTVIPNDANLIQDGATVASGTPDGRLPVTDGQINVLVANATTIVALFEANTNLILNQTLQVAVNGKSVI